MEESQYIYVTIYNDLIKKIKAGEYFGVGKLPTELELSLEYNVSRITISRALNEIKNTGLLSRTKKGGSMLNVKNTKKPIVTAVSVTPFDKNYHAAFFNGFKSLCADNNVFVSHYNSRNIIKEEREVLRHVLEIDPDALVIYPCYSLQNLDLLSKIALTPTKILFLDRAIDGINAPCITTDNRTAMTEIVQRCINDGHRKIAYLGITNQTVPTEKKRFVGFIETLIANGIHINHDYIFKLFDLHEKEMQLKDPAKNRDMLNDSMVRIINKINDMPEYPTVICAVNDFFAANFIEAALTRAPELLNKITVTGFDNIAFEPKHNISFMTVEQDFYTMGQYAVNILLGLTNGNQYNPEIALKGFIVKNTI
jgi:GntR family transcriptional regulator of arabinose operon